MHTSIASLVAALAGSIALAASAAPAVPPTVMCESIIRPAGPISWRPERVVLGVVDIPPEYIPQTVSWRVGRWPYWSKSGLVVRADSPPVLVIVPRQWRSRVAIEWGNVGPASALRIESCPGPGPLGDWNPYSGGFHLRVRSACVPLMFRAGNRTATVRFGVGRRCG
jgi:hypothetical protein